MFSLEGKIAVITGAASGFGKATAERFSRAGAKVVLADITDAGELAKETGGIYLKTDVSKEEQVKNLMAKAVAEFGKIDIVINNAGVPGEVGFVREINEKAFDKEFSVNAKGVLWGIKHAVPHISDGGSIINTSSFAGLLGAPTYGSYVVSKSAVIAVTKTAALELAPRGIRVNCICPGTMDTPMAHGEESDAELTVSKMLQPLGRLGTAEEVAALFHYLASDESAFITGLAIPIDGGMSAGFSLGIIGPLYELAAGKELEL